MLFFAPLVPWSALTGSALVLFNVSVYYVLLVPGYSVMSLLHSDIFSPLFPRNGFVNNSVSGAFSRGPPILFILLFQLSNNSFFLPFRYVLPISSPPRLFHIFFTFHYCVYGLCLFGGRSQSQFYFWFVRLGYSMFISVFLSFGRKCFPFWKVC